jgi:hypothetical protein
MNTMTNSEVVTNNGGDNDSTQPAETTETATPTAKKVADDSDTSSENRWVLRLEELLKVKNLDDLKSELGKLAAEVQTEIQGFDLNAHLSPSAKSRLKSLEQRYNEVIRVVGKAQKQFDREFNKSLRVLKKTRQDAEKHVKDVRAKVSKHRATLLKASKNLTSKLKKTASTARRATSDAKRSGGKSTTKTAKKV